MIRELWASFAGSMLSVEHKRLLRVSASAALTVLALVLLQLALALFYWYPQWSFRAFLQPSWELLFISAGLVGWSVWQGRLWVERTVFALLACFVFSAAFLGVAQGIARREFGYDVVLAIDIKFVPVLLDMMRRTSSSGMFLLYRLLLLSALLLAFALAFWSVRRVYRYAAESELRRFSIGAGLGGYALVCGLLLGFHAPVTAELGHQVDMFLHLEDRLEETKQILERDMAMQRLQNPFPHQEKKRDVIVVVAESYGEILFRDPTFESFKGDMDRFVERARAAGFHARSRFVYSPVFGGSSWMADASFLCGVKIPNQLFYESLWDTSSNLCMPQLFEEAEYRTVLAAANTTFADSRFKELFPFDRLLMKNDFEYEGPRYAWSFVPDQYVLHYLLEQEVAAPAEPLFATILLASSHHPWQAIPTYLEDWSLLGDGAVFNELPAEIYELNGFFHGVEYDEGFAESIRYVFESTAGFLERVPRSDPEPLIIYYGDHQPRKPIGSMSKDPWLVPIHILSRDPAIVDAFAPYGYEPGYWPDPIEGSEEGLEHVLEHVVRVFRDSL